MTGNKYKDLTTLSLEWNEKINITAITDPKEFLKKNILDSLTLVGYKQIEDAKRVLDLGTGGGYPGLPLAINYPDKQFVLADAVKKKLNVIDDIAEKLEISNVVTVHGRAEELAKNPAFRDAFDLVVSRAVANMATLSEWALPFVKPGGYFVAYKTEDAYDEIAAANKAIESLGGKLRSIEAAVSTDSRHVLVFVEKIVETPKRFPRKPNEAKKNPII
ncbi:MAG: 16S rRNA (guanine(527)-N(7))-methyltransferase RsmG [Firmicutes bacterium]|nr:16S rRNA (guanine(527)-N(7))-methyltransferase RsmG [Bacillota bacterium]